MDPRELRSALVALAREAGLEVREARAAPGEPPPASSACRVRGAVWVVLSSADPEPHQNEVLAAALREHRSGWLERRYLAPALREHLFPGVV